MWGFSDICVYDWSAWQGTLITGVAPKARRIRAKFGESAKRLARRLPRRTRLLIVHLDISDNAPFIVDALEFGRALLQGGITALNCLPLDIRKRTVQACCKAYGLPSVSPPVDGHDDELMIVKTDLNSGGTREHHLSSAQKVRFNLPSSTGRVKGPSGYFVKRRADLEAEVWTDPDLVVERYIANAQGRFYRVYVAGNAVVISEAYDHIQVKRMGGDIRRHNHRLWRQVDSLHAFAGKESRLPPDLLHTAGVFMHRFRLDYGALDVVESESGEFHVIDVNKTPFWGSENQPGLLEHLRLGFS